MVVSRGWWRLAITQITCDCLCGASAIESLLTRSSARIVPAITHSPSFYLGEHLERVLQTQAIGVGANKVIRVSTTDRTTSRDH